MADCNIVLTTLKSNIILNRPCIYIIYKHTNIYMFFKYK